MTQHDYAAARTRYKKMRFDGLLAHLPERKYRNNLDSIGLLWHGPPKENPEQMPGVETPEDVEAASSGE